MATVGTIDVIARIDTSQYKKGAGEIEAANDDMEQSSNNVSSANQRAQSSFLNLAKKGVTVAAVAMTGLATTVATMSLRGGFARAMNIEDAQAKLRGLGHDADSVKTIMDNALASVEGTAFGLDAAATTAANAVASGIKPGKQLEQVLKTVANTASVAGRGMDEMGAIFNKVAASNKVQMDVINQLHDAGVPALALLSKEIGKTAEETAKMASAGEINFETFERAMRKGVGEAALEMGKTTRGTLANMQAAFSRAGAVVADNVLPHIRGAMENVRQGVNQFVKDLPGIIDGLVGLARRVYTYISPALNFLRSQVTDRLIPAFQRFIESDAIKNIGTVLVVAFNLITYAIGAVTFAISGLVEGLTIFNPLVIGAVVALTSGAAILGVVRAATVALTAAQAALNAVMRANPFVLVASALIGVASAFALSTNNARQNNNEARNSAQAFYNLRTATDSVRTSYDALRTAQENLSNSQLNLEGSNLAVERAQANYNRVLQDNPPESLEAREAAYQLKRAQDDVRRATDNVAKAEDEVKNKRKEWQKSLSEQRIALQSFNDELSRSAREARNTRDAYQELIDVSSRVAPRGTGGSGRNFLEIPGRASGGPVRAGQPYFVGENRDGSLNRTSELFVPRTSGTIVNSRDLQNALGNGREITVNQYNTIHNNIDMNIATRYLTKRLARA